MQGSSAIDTLKPLSQAAWLLQVNKSTEEDAKEIIEQCTELNPVQVLLTVELLSVLLQNHGHIECMDHLESHEPFYVIFLNSHNNIKVKPVFPNGYIKYNKTSHTLIYDMVTYSFLY